MRNLVLMAAIATLSGCASIISDSRYPVTVTSTPPGASYEVRSERGHTVMTGVTPDQVTLNASAGFFDGETYQVAYRKEGFADKQSTIESTVDGWYWVNILFGGLIGMLIVDPATGAMYKLPENASATLTPLVTEAAQSNAQ